MTDTYRYPTDTPCTRAVDKILEMAGSLKKPTPIPNRYPYRERHVSVASTFDGVPTWWQLLFCSRSKEHRNMGLEEVAAALHKGSKRHAPCPHEGGTS